MTLPIYIYTIDQGEQEQLIVSCLPHEHVFNNGLVPEAIIGKLERPLAEDETITPDIFSANVVFKAFLHDVIAQNAPLSMGLIDEARRQRNGFVYVIDQRTPTPAGEVPPYDIFGGFEVNCGLIVDGSYQRNENHSVLSSDGFFQIGYELQATLIEELTDLKSPQRLN